MTVGRMQSLAVAAAGLSLLLGAPAAASSVAGGNAVDQRNAVPVGWSTFRDDPHGIAISYPASWRAAPTTLTPALVDPVVPVALGTYRLEPERSGECDIVPQRALDALKPKDAFIAVYVFDGMASWTANTTRPAHFSTDMPWYRGHIQCTEHVRGSVRQVTFADHGLNLAVLVAVGSNASAKRRSQVFRILDTLVVGAAQTRSTVSLPLGSVSHQDWTLVPKDAAGLGDGTSFDSLVSNGDSLLLAGARSVDNTWHAAIWRSDDGVRWSETTHPSTTGEVFPTATDGNVALAIGTDGKGFGSSTFVWRSEDGGRTWKTVAHGNDVFGTPAPEMGRPFASQLVRYRGWWVAAGGGSDGYAAIWVSRDGTTWRQTLDSRSAGGVNLTEGPGRSLFAYSYATSGWHTLDPTHWGRPQVVSTPDRFYLTSVAPGATTAFAGNFDRHGVPTPLLRSSDRAHTWTKDNGFLAAFPDASVWTIDRAAGRWIAAGASGTPNHPDAWISTDRRTWVPLPQGLYGSAGGTLSLVAALHGRIVLIGTAPEFDRYYVFDTRPGSSS